MSVTWNKYGLSWKQFQFCQEYLKDYNADRACRVVYGTNSRSNGANCLRSTNVKKYLRDRMAMAMEAAEVNYDYLLKKLREHVDDPDKEVSNTAMKTLQQALKARAEVEAKLAELDKNTDTGNVIINFGEAQKPDES